MIAQNRGNYSPIKVYRSAKGWRIFFAICGPVFIILSGYLMLVPFLEGRAHEVFLVVLCLLLGGGFGILMLCGMITILKWRIEVYPERFREVSVFKSREMKIDDVMGIEILQTQYITMIQFVPKDPKGKKMKVSLTMEDLKEFTDWVNESFRNLTFEGYQQQVKEMLTDKNWGINEAERILKVKRAKRWARFLNVMGWVTLLWSFLIPFPYRVVIWSLVALPIIALISVRLFPGSVKFDSGKNSIYPSIAVPFLLLCVGLSLRALRDWRILSWEMFWFPWAVFSLTLFGLALFCDKEGRQKISYQILVLIICLVYGYGATINLNGILDDSVLDIHTATIINKTIIKDSKATTYNLELSPWGPKRSKNDVEVQKSFYRKQRVGDTIEVVVKEGRLKIPWFYLR